MRNKLRPWQIAAALAAVTLAGISVFVVQRMGQRLGTAEMLAHIPPGDSVLVSLDVEAMRTAGVLDIIAGKKVAEESEYKEFLDGTGFDYRKDLDTVLASFQDGHTFLVLRGRFDWKRLDTYVTAKGGSCADRFCQVEGSRPERKISFFPLNSGTLALAVSSDPSAARHLKDKRESEAAKFQIPEKPVWFSVPGAVLNDPAALPAGTALFAKALSGSQRVTLSLGPAGDGFEALLDASCRSLQDAEALQNQLSGITDLIRTYISRVEQKPNPRDLSGILTAGTFTRRDNRVHGRWPVGKEFIEAMAGEEDR